MVLGEIEAGLSLWDRFSRLWRQRPVKEESIADRFLMLFGSHGVHRNQIPRFFGHDLTIADVQDQDVLALKLTEEILENACSLFNVNRTWIDGASKDVYPTYCFYKQSEVFDGFLEAIVEKSSEAYFYAFLLVPRNCTYPDQAVLVLQERVGEVGDSEINRFYLCNRWSFCYWKARADLTACLAIVAKHGIFMKGVYADPDYIKEIEDGKKLLGWGCEGGWQVEGEWWEAEDMVYQPDLFLKGLNHKDGYSDISALSRWLELSDKGFMKTEVFPDPLVNDFQEKLFGMKNKRA